MPTPRRQRPLSGARVASARGKPLTTDEIQRIRMLLADTDLPMPMTAERMNCTRSSIAKINKKFQVRAYNGQRTKWAKAGEGVRG